MTLLQAVISGIIQGITEFFPISSSGHLVILHKIFGLRDPQVAFDVFLHVGTLMSVLVYFRADIARLFTVDKRRGLFVIIGSIPAAIAGVFWKGRIERLFAVPKAVGIMLLLTGIWLFIANASMLRSQRAPAGAGERPLNWWRSLLVGLGQSAALLPGISRSGATIGAAVISGMGREEAFSFSFLLSIPAIAGATILKFGEIGSAVSGGGLSVFALGGVTSMLVGLAALKVLSNIIRRNKLYYFGVYCVLAGAAVILLV
ncbi:undecaprenyl-diphosphate phosphatase [Candidatus Omnitrophota bacterium]